MADMPSLIEAWQLTRDLHDLRPGATGPELSASGARLGCSIPRSLGALLRFSNGGSYLRGNLGIDRVEDIVGVGDRLRSSGWRLPASALPIGTDGAGSIVALWYPRGQRADANTHVVLIGDPDVEGYMAVVGTSLPGFLTGWTAFYLVALGTSGAALDVLGLPAELRIDLGETGPYVAWANAGLTTSPDPFEARLTSMDVAALTRHD